MYYVVDRRYCIPVKIPEIDRFLFPQRFQKQIYLHLFTNCFMKILLHRWNKYSIILCLKLSIEQLPSVIPEHIWIIRVLA